MIKYLYVFLVLFTVLATLAWLSACGDDDDDNDNDSAEEQGGCCYWGCDPGDPFSKDVQSGVSSESECLEVAMTACGYEPDQYELVSAGSNCDVDLPWWENWGL